MVLAGCTDAPEPAEPTSSSAAPSVEPSSPAPEPDPTLQPEGSADDNLAFFAFVVDGVWANGQPLDGRAYVDALEAAGFDKQAMQVTNDQTSLGGPVDSIQFSVLWADECLIGQAGPAIGEPVAIVAPRVRGGECLVGQTRPIDW